MKLKIWLAMLTVVLTLTSCAAICKAQEAQVVERLPDGDLIVKVDGREYRAITAAKAVELQERKINLTSCEKQLVLSDQRTVLLTEQNAVLSGQVKALSSVAEILARQSSEVTTRRDSWAKQLATLAWPIVNVWLASR